MAKPKESTHRQLLRLQKRIYRSLKRDVERLMGPSPRAIQRYEKEYRSDFRSGKLKSITKSQLIRAIRAHDITFIADFHTFGQAQRTALRLIRDAVKAGEQWFLGLEFVPSHFQGTLDAYCSGKLSWEAFLEIIRYNEEWGFSPSNYAPLLDWARQNGVRMVALNEPRDLLVRQRNELHLRDRWSAGLITDLLAGERKAGHKARMVVLYGELHVARRHLPAQVQSVSRPHFKEPLKSISIHQNYDPLYWRVAEVDKELRSEIVELSKSAYCVFSSTPIAKLQSLLDWLEGASVDAAVDDVETADALSLISSYGRTLSEFLGIPAPLYEGLTVKTIENGFMASAGLSNRDLAIARYLVSANQRFYLPPETVYLASPTQNAAAELAAIHLLGMRWRDQEFFRPEVDFFYRLVLESTFGFFGSLIVNPRRKCDLAADHAKRRVSIRQGAVPAFQFEDEIRRLVLDFVGNGRNGSKTSHVGAVQRMLKDRRRAGAGLIAARFIGQIFGKKLHNALRSESITVDQIRDFFLSQSPGSGKFETKFHELEHWLARASIEASKSDVL